MLVDSISSQADQWYADTGLVPQVRARFDVSRFRILLGWRQHSPRLIVLVRAHDLHSSTAEC
eukprot:1347420-Pleurochrysis_carterae.AAC.1